MIIFSCIIHSGVILLEFMPVVKRVMCMKKIILASASPRRKELLEMLGFGTEVRPSKCGEDIDADSPENLVMRLSDLKCSSVAKKMSSEDKAVFDAVLGADTVVVLDGRIIGKPEDAEDAFRILKQLSGRTHSVYTGVTIINTFSGEKETFFEKTDVTFFDVTDEDIRGYIATGEPMDKAGAYGMQGKGAFLVEKINGDFYTVVGLPVARVCRILSRF